MKSRVKELYTYYIFNLQGHIGYPGVDGAKGEQGNIRVYEYLKIIVRAIIAVFQEILYLPTTYITIVTTLVYMKMLLYAYTIQPYRCAILL